MSFNFYFVYKLILIYKKVKFIKLSAILEDTFTLTCSNFWNPLNN